MRDANGAARLVMFGLVPQMALFIQVLGVLVALEWLGALSTIAAKRLVSAGASASRSTCAAFNRSWSGAAVLDTDGSRAPATC